MVDVTYRMFSSYMSSMAPRPWRAMASRARRTRHSRTSCQLMPSRQSVPRTPKASFIDLSSSLDASAQHAADAFQELVIVEQALGLQRPRLDPGEDLEHCVGAGYLDAVALEPDHDRVGTRALAQDDLGGGLADQLGPEGERLGHVVAHVLDPRGDDPRLDLEQALSDDGAVRGLPDAGHGHHLPRDGGEALGLDPRVEPVHRQERQDGLLGR